MVRLGSSALSHCYIKPTLRQGSHVQCETYQVRQIPQGSQLAERGPGPWTLTFCRWSLSLLENALNRQHAHCREGGCCVLSKWLVRSSGSRQEVQHKGLEGLWKQFAGAWTNSIIYLLCYTGSSEVTTDDLPSHQLTWNLTRGSWKPIFLSKGLFCQVPCEQGRVSPFWCP